LCRAWASELDSDLKPQLDAHGVSLVVVGLEELGVQSFVDGKFFSGEHYLDQDLAIYKAMDFKRISMLSIPGQIISKETRQIAARANSLGIKGDMKGNGLQAGGTFAVDQTGKTVFDHRQTTISDHPKISDILASLGITGAATGSPPEAAASL